MEGKDFAIWIFAAAMVLSPMAMAAMSRPYRGEPVATATPAPSPTTSNPSSTATTPKP